MGDATIVTLRTEPPDGATVARFAGPWWPEAVYVRDDDGARDGGYGDQHWHRIKPTNGEYQTWADVVADVQGYTLIRLYREGER